MILKRHKNAFFQSIQEFGLDIGDFRFIEGSLTRTSRYYGYGSTGTDESPSSFTLQYKNSPLRFTITEEGRAYDVFSANFTAFERGFQQWDMTGLDGAPLNEILGIFEIWIHDHLAQYIEEESLPDLWAQSLMSREVLGDFLTDPLDETTFTAIEKQEIRLALERFRVSIEESFQPSEIDSATIAERLDYLIQAVDRLNKTDWRGIAISTVIGIATTLGLDSEKGRLLYGLLQQAFTTAWHLLSR